MSSIKAKPENKVDYVYLNGPVISKQNISFSSSEESLLNDKASKRDSNESLDNDLVSIKSEQIKPSATPRLMRQRTVTKMSPVNNEESAPALSMRTTHNSRMMKLLTPVLKSIKKPSANQVRPKNLKTTSS